MKILLIADPVIPVPPHQYGGTERIVALYAEELTRLGHTVHLIAGPGSRDFGGGLVVYHPPNNTSLLSRAYRKLRFQLSSLLAAIDVDVVYSFCRIDYLEGLLRTGSPILHCFQNPALQYQIDYAEQRARGPLAFHCVSHSQSRKAQFKEAMHVIPNPIDTRSYTAKLKDEGYLAFLGRLTHDKGVDTAIAVARQAGLPLVLAGNITQEEGAETFFRDQVEPYLDGERIRWIGPVNDAQKQSFLSGARALLFPIRWDEPFGIVMTEALACGTPVIATRRASTPEVIEHGVTGWLCDEQPDLAGSMVEAVGRLAAIDRSRCRQAAEKYFDIQNLAPRVVEALDILTHGGSPCLGQDH